MDAVYQVLDWFVPEPIKADSEALQRARMFLLSHMFGPVLGNTITVYLFASDPDPGFPLWVLGASISWFWLFPWLLKLTHQFVFLALLSVQNLTFATLWGCYYWGGVSSPFLPWLLTVPLLAFFYLGAARKLRFIVLGLIAIDLCIFYVVYATVGSFPDKIPLADLERVGIISTVCAAIYVSIMALYYANIVASQSELEREVQNHRATAIKLLEATEEAERANHAKSEFLARMSHELRTPLNAVIGYSEMLREDAEIGGRAEQVEDLEKINGSGKDLLKLITELLDLAKIEAGKMEVFTEPVDLGALLRDAVARAEPLAEKNGNAIVLLDEAGAGKIEADATKLREIVLHLLSNAAKFTQKGRISVAVRREQRRSGEWVHLSVEDTGIGMQRDQLPLLFQSFGDAETSTSSKYGTRGLGLALSRKLCRLMGGDITVVSEPDRGSCFTVHLPATPAARRAADGAEPAAGMEALSGKTVVVIDEDVAVLDLTRTLLAKHGMRVVQATDPDEGIRLAKTKQAAAIVLDILLRGDNGWDVLRSLKSDPELASCPVIMLTVINDRRMALALGAADHLTKPVDHDALLGALRRVCTAGADDAAAGADRLHEEPMLGMAVNA
jgi:signal transduction histidine kinase/CheY-like chemotaxis protein